MAEDLSEKIRELVRAGGRRGVTLKEVTTGVGSSHAGKATGLFHKLVGKGELVEMPGGRFRLVERLPSRARSRTPEPTAPAPRGEGRERAPQAEATGEPAGQDSPEAPDGRDASGARIAMGRISVHREGFGFVTSESGTPDDDVFVARRSTKGAMSGDRVRVVWAPDRERKGRYKGEVLEILERSRTHLAGYLERVEAETFRLFPTNPEIPVELVVDRSDAGGAKPGAVVLARILDYGGPDREPRGKVEKVLGERGDPAIDAEMIIAEHGIRTQWPEPVMAAQAGIPDRVDPGELGGGRLDLRDQPCVTIDGKDARDLDDAVHLEPREDGGFRLWVHVADVSHYVRPGTAIDLEARQRGTSTYFPDRVIPMLPVRLSNGICSLNPDEDRMALSCRMDFDATGKRRALKVASTVIRSHGRLDYDTVHAACIDREPAARKKLAPHLAMLEAMFAAAGVLRVERKKNGYIDFDLPQAKVKVDEQGVPVAIVPMAHNEAYGLIEQFMVAANEAVSHWMVEGRRAFAFRIHETPDPEKLKQLAELARGFGLKPGRLLGREPGPAIADLIVQSEGRPEENLIRTLALRCMKLAAYSPRNEGHFGLGSRAYTHFTSPIRRYPDLIVHRLLKDRTGDLPLSEAEKVDMVERLGDLLRAMSFLERKAEAAERDAIRLKKIHYMGKHLGQELTGVVSGAREFGLFVELVEVLVDGFIHVSKLGGDYWQYDQEGHRLVGANTGREWRLGDRIQVRVESVDPIERKIMLVPAEAEHGAVPDQGPGEEWGEEGGDRGSRRGGRGRGPKGKARRETEGRGRAAGPAAPAARAPARGRGGPGKDPAAVGGGESGAGGRRKKKAGSARTPKVRTKKMGRKSKR